MKHIMTCLDNVVAYIPNKKFLSGLIVLDNGECIYIRFDDTQGFETNLAFDDVVFNTNYLLEPSDFKTFTSYLSRHYPAYIDDDVVSKMRVNPSGMDDGLKHIEHVDVQVGVRRRSVFKPVCHPDTKITHTAFLYMLNFFKPETTICPSVP